MVMKPSARIAEAGVKTSVTAEVVALFPTRSATSKVKEIAIATSPPSCVNDPAVADALSCVVDTVNVPAL